MSLWDESPASRSVIGLDRRGSVAYALLALSLVDIAGSVVHLHLEDPVVTRTQVIWLALQLMVPVSAAANADGGLFFYQDGAGRVTLTPVPWTFAFLSDTAGTTGLAGLLDAAGYADARIHNLESGRWLAELRNASDPPPIQGVTGVIGRILDLDRRDRFYISPQFDSAVGILWFGPVLTVTFEDGVDEQEIDELVEAVGVPVSEKIRAARLANTYYFTTLYRSALDILDAANCLHLFPEVVDAYPQIHGDGLTSIGGSPPEDEGELFPAETGGINDQYIVLLNPGPAPVEAEADELTRQFGGKVQRAWETALRGFLVNMNANQAQGMVNAPLVKGIYQDMELPADEVLANAAPYCYPVSRGDCDPPGNWILNNRSFLGFPQTIACDDPDPLASGCIDNWGLDRLDGFTVSRDDKYQSTAQGTGVHVYVLDTGIKANNLDFGGRVSGGHNATFDEPGCAACFPSCFPPCGTDTNDYHGHGTHVAGIVGGQFFGVAKDVHLHPVRFVNNSCDLEISALVEGIDWIAATHAPAMGTGIVNLSTVGFGWSSAPFFQALRDAVIGLVSRDDLLLVQSAGNAVSDACPWVLGDESQYTPGSPEYQATSRVVIVGGSDENDGRWICDPDVDENCNSLNQGSNFGSCLDLFAPAAHIVSAWHGGGGVDDDKAACRLSGTSMSSPHVAGIAALVLEDEPFLSAPLLKARILDQALIGVLNDDNTHPNYIGVGSPNLLASLSRLIFADGFETGDMSAWSSVVQ